MYIRSMQFYSDWEKVSAPTEKQIVAYEQLPQNGDASSLKKLAVLKVNGGLGTTMGEDWLIYLTSIFDLPQFRHGWSQECS